MCLSGLPSRADHALLGSQTETVKLPVNGLLVKVGSPMQSHWVGRAPAGKGNRRARKAVLVPAVQGGPPGGLILAPIKLGENPFGLSFRGVRHFYWRTTRNLALF